MVHVELQLELLDRRATELRFDCKVEGNGQRLDVKRPVGNVQRRRRRLDEVAEDQRLHVGRAVATLERCREPRAVAFVGHQRKKRRLDGLLARHLAVGHAAKDRLAVRDEADQHVILEGRECRVCVRALGDVEGGLDRRAGATAVGWPQRGAQELGLGGCPDVLPERKVARGRRRALVGDADAEVVGLA